MSLSELSALSKDALIEVHRRVFGNVGDTGRTSKEKYVARLLEADPEKVVEAVAEVSAQGNGFRPLAANPSDAGAQLAALIQSLAAGSVNEDRVRAIVSEMLGAIEPKRGQIIIREGQQSVAIDERTHPVFEEALRAVSAGLNVLLVGPAGCGKTHLMRMIAKALGARQTAILSGSAGASESQLQGWLLPVGDSGRFEYVPSAYVDVYQNGGLAGLDELDAYDPNMLLCANASLANGHMFIPQRYQGPMIPRHEQAFIMATANTYGTGADMVYAGRNQLDAATLDRFYVIPMDYDRELEAELAPAAVCSWAWSIRERATAAKIRRVVSTRTIQKGAAMLATGAEWEHVKTRLLAGWTRDELAKVGEAAQ